MANSYNPLARRFASFGARLIRFTFIITAYVIGGSLSASLTRLNRQMTRNDAQLASTRQQTRQHKSLPRSQMELSPLTSHRTQGHPHTLLPRTCLSVP